MQKIAIKVGGVLCILAGLATVWLPIPTGLALMAIGLGLLLTVSRQVAAWLRWLRQRSPRLDGGLGRIEVHMPDRFRQALARTRAKRAAAKARKSAPPKAPAP